MKLSKSEVYLTSIHNPSTSFSLTLIFYILYIRCAPIDRLPLNPAMIDLFNRRAATEAGGGLQAP